MTELVPLVLAFLLVGSSIGAIIVRRLLWSLILLFYSSLLLGGILFWYGAVYAGLFHIITFAGAVSVMFMVILMLVGQDPSDTAGSSPVSALGAVLAIVGIIPLIILLGELSPISNRIMENGIVSPSASDLSFLWNYQSWNMVFVLVPIAAAVLVVVNLFSKEGEAE